jgi:hypothetical protein
MSAQECRDAEECRRVQRSAICKGERERERERSAEGCTSCSGVPRTAENCKGVQSASYSTHSSALGSTLLWGPLQSCALFYTVLQSLCTPPHSLHCAALETPAPDERRRLEDCRAAEGCREEQGSRADCRLHKSAEACRRRVQGSSARPSWQSCAVRSSLLQLVPFVALLGTPVVPWGPKAECRSRVQRTWCRKMRGEVSELHETPLLFQLSTSRTFRPKRA